MVVIMVMVPSTPFTKRWCARGVMHYGRSERCGFLPACRITLFPPFHALRLRVMWWSALWWCMVRSSSTSSSTNRTRLFSARRLCQRCDHAWRRASTASSMRPRCGVCTHVLHVLHVLLVFQTTTHTHVSCRCNSFTPKCMSIEHQPHQPLRINTTGHHQIRTYPHADENRQGSPQLATTRSGHTCMQIKTAKGFAETKSHIVNFMLQTQPLQPYQPPIMNTNACRSRLLRALP